MDGTPFRSQELLDIEWSNTSSMQFPNGWGVVVDGYPVMYCGGTIPDSILSGFRKRKQYIFLLETFAQVLVLLLFWPEMGPYYMSYINNLASQWALTKGYSSDSECNTIVGLFWIMSGILGISPWFERVPSKAQLVDAPSRGVLSFGKSLGWRRLDFHLDPLWEAISTTIQEGRDWDVKVARHILSLSSEIPSSL